MRKYLLRDLTSADISQADKDSVCTKTKVKAAFSPEWLTYLNAPGGYANPVWTEENVCLRIDELEQ